MRQEIHCALDACTHMKELRSCIAPQGLSRPQKGLQPALIARTNRGAGVTQGSTAKSVGGRRDRRAEALAHIVQALRAGSTRRPFGRWTMMDAIAPQGLSRPQKGLQPALIARTNRGAGVTQGSKAKSVGGRRDRRAEALPHIVQALRAAIVIGGDRRAEALPHIVQALRAGSTRRPFGRWTVMDAIAPQGLSRPQKGLQPACKNRGKGFSPHRAQPKPDLKPETET